MPLKVELPFEIFSMTSKLEASLSPVPRYSAHLQQTSDSIRACKAAGPDSVSGAQGQTCRDIFTVSIQFKASVITQVPKKSTVLCVKDNQTLAVKTIVVQ